MRDYSHRSFRPGVRSTLCTDPLSLAEAVSLLLASETVRPELNALELIEIGAVYVENERSLNPARLLKPGETLRIHTTPRRYQAPTDLAIRVLSESEDWLVVEKPADLPSEPLVDNIKENLLSFLEDLRGQTLFMTNRLSTESEGLMLVAKNQRTMHAINRAFTEGRIRRRYVLYTESPLTLSENSPFQILSITQQTATTHLISEGKKTWQIIGEPLHECFRIEIEFTHARPKEIRQYFADQSNPILGDRVHSSHWDLRELEGGHPTLAFLALALAIDE